MNITEHPKRVFIFGAGASASSGAPLMNNFLDKAEYVYRKFMLDKNYEPNIKKHFELVFNALDSMQTLHSKSNINLDNIEDVFGAFEIARLIRKLGSLPIDEIDNLNFSTSILIAHTIEHTCNFQRGANGFNPAGSDYRSFVKKLIDNVKDAELIFHNNIFITFNYDVCLDAAIHYQGLPIEYGLKDNINSSAVKIFKLHGSINWAECLEQNCREKIFIIDLNDHIKKLLSKKRIQTRQHQNEKLYFISEYSKYPHQLSTDCCNSLQKFRPLIVPPTWNKTSFHNQIYNVWRNAANALSEAEYIYVVGYSLPETDVFFRLLYSIGSQSKTRLKKFLVINSDADSKSRFDTIVSQGRIHRYDFKPIEFEKSIEDFFKIE